MGSRAPLYLSTPAAFTFASHSPEDDSSSDSEQHGRNSSSSARTSDVDASGMPLTPSRAPMAAKHRRASLAVSPSRVRDSSTTAPPTSPALARAKTSVVVEQNENAPGNDVPFEEIAALLTTRTGNKSAVGEQVKVRLTRSYAR